MGQTKGGIRATGGDQSHSGKTIRQAPKEIQKQSGMSGSGNIKIKNPTVTNPMSTNPTQQSPKVQTPNPSKQQYGTGQERTGHKYLKREWIPKISKWRYWYRAPNGEKYHSYDKLHQEHENPEHGDDISHVRMAMHHHENEIKNLKELHSKIKDQSESQKILNRIKEHQKNSHELSQIENNLMLKNPNQKFEKINDHPWFKRNVLNILNKLSSALEKRSLGHTKEAKKINLSKYYAEEYIDSLLWQEKYRPKTPMSQKVSKAERDAKEYYENLKVEEKFSKKWQDVIKQQIEDNYVDNSKEHINNIKNNLSKTETENKTEIDKNFNNYLSNITKKLKQTLLIEDVKGSITEEPKEQARSVIFYIRANEKTKPSILESHLNEIKKQISSALNVDKNKIQIIRHPNKLNTIGISIPKDNHKLFVGLKDYIDSVSEKYDKNKIKNPYFLGFNIDRESKALNKKQLNMISLDGENSHIFCGGTTGTGKSNAILADIITQKAIGRKVKSFIMDPSMVHIYKDLSENFHDIHYTETINDIRHCLMSISSEIKLRNSMKDEDIPPDGHQEIRVYIDEMNRLFEDLKLIKRSKKYKNEKSPEDIIREIAREGRKANVHIITFGQNTRLEDIPADLRDNSLKVALNAKGIKLPGMPDGQQFLTPMGHNLSDVSGSLKESLLPKVSKNDINLILKKNALNDETYDELNVDDEKNKTIKDEIDTSYLNNDENISTAQLSSQVDDLKSKKIKKQDIKSKKSINKWLQEESKKKGKAEFNYNDLIVNFKKKTDKIISGKEGPDAATSNIMENISKHPDAVLSTAAKKAKKVIDKKLQNAPHIKDLDAANGLKTLSGDEKISKRGRKPGVKNKPKEKVQTIKTEGNNESSKSPSEEMHPVDKITSEIINHKNISDLTNYYKSLKKKNFSDEDISNGIKYLHQKFNNEFNHKEIQNELNKIENYKKMSKDEQENKLKELKRHAFNRYINRNIKTIQKQPNIDKAFLNSLNEAFPEGHNVHQYHKNGLNEKVSSFVNGISGKDGKNNIVKENIKENNPSKENISSNKKNKTWQDIINEPENYNEDDNISLDTGLEDTGNIKDDEKQLNNENQKNTNLDNKQIISEPQEYRGLTIYPSDNGVSVRHPKDDYALAEFNNIDDAKKYSDHLVNNSDVSDKKKFDKDWYNLHTDAIKNLKK